MIESLWSVDDVARYFQTSGSTVYRSILCRPTFPRPIKIPGGPKRWKPQEVQEWAERQKEYIKPGSIERASKHPIYNVWKKMKDRCHNENSDSYKWYGAKGIVVCERWRNDFHAFLVDMGERPSVGHSIDRIDSSKGYEPWNCRWSTQKDQNRNKASNKYIDYNGKKYCLTKWSEILGGDKTLVSKRIINGWNPIDAITTPPNQRHANS